MANFYGQYVGFGAGESAPPYEAWEGAGESYGFIAAANPDTGATLTRIEKLSFASGTEDATDSGVDTIDNSTNGVQRTSVVSSPTNGYFMGGFYAGPEPLYSDTDVVQRFSFAATSGTTTDIANLTVSRMMNVGLNSTTYGYSCGGTTYEAGYENNPFYTIDKIQFSSDSTTSGHGDLSTYSGGRYGGDSGCASSTYGYVHGSYRSGGPAPTQGSHNVIDKFAFASNTTASDVGDLTVNRYFNSANASGTHGYVSSSTGAPKDRIEKWSFATDGNAVTVGALTVGRGGCAGMTQTSYGYVAGGYTYPPFAGTTVIDRFSLETDGDAAGVGDLLMGGNYHRGFQV